MPVSEFATVPLGYSRLACIHVIKHSSHGFVAFSSKNVAMPPAVSLEGTLYGPYFTLTRSDLWSLKNEGSIAVTLGLAAAIRVSWFDQSLQMLLLDLGDLTSELGLVAKIPVELCR
jgi:hypothetical protein